MTSKREQTSRAPLDDLRCPACQSRLVGQDAAIHCTSCGKAFGYDNGIPDLRLSRMDYYFNPIPRERMREMSEALDAENWVSTVREFVRLTRNPSWVDNVAVQGRYAWKLLMDLPSQGRALDIGCGLGALTSSVAPHVRTSFATDLTVERLVFARRRFDIFNADDDVRTVASGDGEHLPFPDASFDAVFLSGVLEWIGCGDTSGFSQGTKWERLVRMLKAQFGDANPRTIQVRFLREVLRILKPTGQLYVGIENRLSYEYFGKRRDHHSQLWYASLLPRFAATLYSLWKSRRPYRTYTFGLKGYQRLFAEAGFGSVEIFGFNNGYSDLKAVTPAAATVERWRPEPPKPWGERISRHPRLVPAYGILATPGKQQPPRFLDRILSEVEEGLGAGAIAFSAFDVTEGDKAVLSARLGETPLVVKFPLSIVCADRERANRETLLALRAQVPTLRTLLPDPLLEGSCQRQPYFVETRVPGVPLENGWSKGPGSAAVQAVRAALNGAAQGSMPCTFDDAAFRRHVAPRLETLRGVLPGPDECALAERFFRQSLEGMNLQIGPMHGDLIPRRVLLQGGRVSGLVSWHAGAVEGLPILDAVGLAAGVLGLQNPGEALPAILARLAEGRWRGTAAEPALSGHLDDGSGSSRERAGAVYLYWLYRVTHLLPFGLQYDQSRIDAVIAPVLDVFRQHARRAA